MNIQTFVKENSKRLLYIKSLIDKEADLAEKSALLGLLAYMLDTHAGIYADNYLESELVKIAQSIQYMPSFERNSMQGKERVLHIASQVYPTGGHTRVINSWIENDEAREYSLFLTNVKSERPAWLFETVKRSGGQIYIDPGSLNYIERAKKMREIASQYDRIVLHIHPYDILPILAFGHDQWERPVYFLNHADHRFWIGISVSDFILDISKEGNSFTKKRRGALKTQILPVPQSTIAGFTLNRQKCRGKLSIPDHIKVAVTMANRSKFRPIEGYNFFEFVLSLIKEYDDFYIIVIGPDLNDPLWKDVYMRSQGKVIAIGEKMKEETAPILAAANLYLDSFPFNSGTSLIEAIKQKIPIFSLRMPWSAFDVYSDLQSNSLGELKQAVDIFLREGITYNLEERKERYIESHCKEGWLKRLNNIFAIPIVHQVMPHFQSKNYLFDEYDKIFFSFHFEPSGLVDQGFERLLSKLFKSNKKD